MKRPIPETLSATLPSDGYADHRITRHSFKETRPVVLPTPDGEAWEYIYACDETGAERRWGTRFISLVPAQELN